jgi:lipopolysaccharide transport system permease protein
MKNENNQWYAPIMHILQRRQLLASAVLATLRHRYAGSFLGLIWVVLGPALLLCLYAAIYLVVFRIRPTNMEPGAYVLYIFSGLVPLISFSQGLAMATGSLHANKDVLLNTVFPPELVTVKEAAASIVNLAIGVGIILVAATFVGQITLHWLLIPVVVLLLFMFLVGVTWVLALANLVVKDIQQVLTYVTIMLLVASPIGYTPDMLPQSMQMLVYFNPLAYFVIFLQSIIVLGELPDLYIMIGVSVFGIGGMAAGSFMFSRAKGVFYDYA